MLFPALIDIFLKQVCNNFRFNTHYKLDDSLHAMILARYSFVHPDEHLFIPHVLNYINLGVFSLQFSYYPNLHILQRMVEFTSKKNYVIHLNMHKIILEEPI